MLLVTLFPLFYNVVAILPSTITHSCLSSSLSLQSSLQQFLVQFAQDTHGFYHLHSIARHFPTFLSPHTHKFDPMAHHSNPISACTINPFCPLFFHIYLEEDQILLDKTPYFVSTAMLMYVMRQKHIPVLLQSTLNSKPRISSVTLLVPYTGMYKSQQVNLETMSFSPNQSGKQEP